MLEKVSGNKELPSAVEVFIVERLLEGQLHWEDTIPRCLIVKEGAVNG
jgi:hypothetical protein